MLCGFMGTMGTLFLRHPPISTIEYTIPVFVIVGVFTVATVAFYKKPLILLHFLWEQ